jgi:phage-related protein
VDREGHRSVVAKIGELIAKMLKPFARFGSLLVNKGKDLVGGLMTGIGRMGKKLAGYVKKFVTDHIPSKVAKVLGIRSPSRVMAAQAKFIPLGMIQGIESQHAHVDRAMGRLSNRITLTPPALEPLASSTTATTRGHNGALFHIDTVEAQDVNHFLREMQARGRARAGGGVNF